MNRIRCSPTLRRRRRSGRQAESFAGNVRHNHLSTAVVQRLIDGFGAHVPAGTVVIVGRSHAAISSEIHSISGFFLYLRPKRRVVKHTPPA